MQFFKTFFASLLGTILGILLLILIIFAAVVSSSSEPEPYIRSNTVLKISLSGDIPERTPDDPLQELLNPGAGAKVSVASLKNNLQKAAVDDNIAGIWVTANNVLASWANLEAVYDAFGEYKESGKFLYFSTDDIGMNERAYFIASIADSVFYPPETYFEFDGFVANFSFYREFFDKIGLEPEIFRVGKYKSAVEPFMRNESSPESREQTRAILDATTDTFVEAVAKRTGKSVNEIHELLNTPPVDRTSFAKEHGLIDVLAYEPDVERHIKKRIDLDEDASLRTIGFGRYARVSAKRAGLDEVSTSDKIAVLYNSGAIMPQIVQSPFSQQTNITYKSVKRQLDSALEDDDVKAIVLYIYSPGGAATTSDLLWNYIREAGKKKPVIASMGSVAASGGYYMAAAADTIVASPNTITGSIGIFNLLFNTQELYNDKLGVRFETMTSHEYSDLFNLTRPFTPAEERVIRQNVESGYESFLQVVADSRGMTRDEVHEVAQGRVWTGTDALDAGLVDILGDIDKAIEIAAEMAEIEEYRLDIYPKRKDLFETLFGSANAHLHSMLRSWIPGSVEQPFKDASFWLNKPAGMNWAILPIHFEID